MERLQLFHVFTSTWFSLGLVVLVASILFCTIDRTPRLWRQSADVRVVQPDAYFDPVEPGETFQDDGIPRYNGTWQYLDIPRSQLRWSSERRSGTLQQSRLAAVGRALRGRLARARLALRARQRRR